MSNQAQKLTFAKLENVFLKDLGLDEAWVKARIIEDPSLLNLGKLKYMQHEVVEPNSGRLDLLFYSPQWDRYYEVEVMLGQTDESHIIRTLEYWDYESKKHPNKEHFAVLIAEDITKRFFNVIYLLNNAFPIIVIQLNALKWEDKVSLNFSTILNLPTGGDNTLVDEKFWQNKVDIEDIGIKSFQVANEILTILKSSSNELVYNYTKSYIALQKDGHNIIAVYPTKNEEGNCRIDMRFDVEDKDEITNNLDLLGIRPNQMKDELMTITLNEQQYHQNKELLDKIFQKSKDY